jgi:hypothetical protein
VRRSLWLAGLIVLAVAACECAGTVSGGACNDPDDCPEGELCVAGVCRPTDPSNPEGTDGGELADGGTQPPCIGLQCQQVFNCPGGGSTVLTGKVYTPKGDLPLYNAIVYVPNGQVAPFVPGVSCDTCEKPTGNPLVTTRTGPDGTFRLENVPTGEDIPLVLQLGRWRRQVTVPRVEACVEAEITDVELLRMPRHQGEGDIPQMAIATGNADPFECLLRKVGLDDAEFTAPSGGGRVHYFRENGVNMAPAAPPASELWSSLENLSQYDVVMLPCEGSERSKPEAAQQNIIDYTSAGGRVFATHFSYVWIKLAPEPFPSVANWANRTSPTDPYTLPFEVDVDTSFLKGSSFAEWLVHVGASQTEGKMSLVETRHSADSVNAALATRWLHGHNPRANRSITTHFTFNTPVADLLPDGGAPDQCGRVVFSSFHVSANAKISGVSTFPDICRDDPPSDQEKALIFMLFDLAACVERDEIPPQIN